MLNTYFIIYFSIFINDLNLNILENVLLKQNTSNLHTDIKCIKKIANAPQLVDRLDCNLIFK